MSAISPASMRYWIHMIHSPLKVFLKGLYLVPWFLTFFLMIYSILYLIATCIITPMIIALISVSHKDISVLSAQLENEAQVMAKWFADSSMKANADKFQGIILPGGRENKDVQISLGGVDIAFVQK